MKRILLFLLFFLITSLINAQSDFKLALEQKDGSKWFIKELGNNIAWVENTLPSKKIKSKKTGKYINLNGGKFVEYWICDCKEKKYSSESGAKYDGNGNFTSNLPDVYNERLLPNTVGETILNIICGYEEYLEDIRQKEYDALVRPTNEELNNTINRRNVYLNGFTTGYKTVYCAPYTDCFIEDYKPNEITFADDPYLDFSKGYQEGEAKAKNDKNKSSNSK